MRTAAYGALYLKLARPVLFFFIAPHPMSIYRFDVQAKDGIIELPAEVRHKKLTRLLLVAETDEPGSASTASAFVADDDERVYPDPRTLTPADRRRLLEELSSRLPPFPDDFKPLSREEANER